MNSKRYKDTQLINRRHRVLTALELRRGTVRHRGQQCLNLTRNVYHIIGEKATATHHTFYVQLLRTD